MTHGSLFSGIGGFDLAAEWMGWENKFHCEWEDFPRRVLKHYWPHAESYGDIKQTDFTIWRGRIDILTGGFPCQPYSQAGKRLGKEDDRHLWPEMLRTIREVAPRWVVGENVRGLINWNGGLVFDEVQADLEAEGYQVLPFLLPACGVNAPHRRDRIWFVTHRKDCGLQGKIKQEQEYGVGKRGFFEHRQGWGEMGREHSGLGNTRPTAHTGHTEPPRPEQHTTDKQGRNGKGIQEGDKPTPRSGIEPTANATGFRGRKRTGGEKPQFDGQFNTRSRWETFPTKPPVCGGNDGLPRELDGITFSKWRNESIKAYGNAIVPQVAYQIFKAIQQYESNAK